MLWALAGAFLTLLLLLNIPAVKGRIGAEAGGILSRELGAEVTIRRIDVGFLNRIIIDDVLLRDRQGNPMLSAHRLSAKISLTDLLRGKITIASAQIFGMDARLYRKTASAEPNFQFVLDALASEDTTRHSPPNLQISSVVIRRGQVRYDQLDAPQSERFTPRHIRVSDISSHIILNTLTGDSISLNVKRISASERSGLRIKKLSLRLTAGKEGAELSELSLQLPSSQVGIPSLTATYEMDGTAIRRGSMRLGGSLEGKIMPSDLQALSPLLDNCDQAVALRAEVQGTDEDIRVSPITLTQGGNFSADGSAALTRTGEGWHWSMSLNRLLTSSQGLENIAQSIGFEDRLPAAAANIGNIYVSGYATVVGRNVSVSVGARTDIGSADVELSRTADSFKASAACEGLDLATLFADSDLGLVSGTMEATGSLDGNDIQTAQAKTDIGQITYRGHQYGGICATAEYAKGRELSVVANIDDEAGAVSLHVSRSLGRMPRTQFNVSANNLRPKTLSLSDKWGDAVFSLNISGDVTGDDVNTMTGDVLLKDLTMQDGDGEYRLNGVTIHKENVGDEQRLLARSDFGSLTAEGKFDFRTLYASLTEAVHDRLPTLPGLTRRHHAPNRASLYATITKADWARKLLGVPVSLHEPLHLIADIDDAKHRVNVTLDAARFSYNGSRYRDGDIIISSPNDTLKFRVDVTAIGENGDTSRYGLRAKAMDNHLTAQMNVSIDGRYAISGNMNADGNFYKDSENRATADIRILPSEVHVGDTVWNIEPARIVYYKRHLAVEDFSIHHDNQHVNISGLATDGEDDSIVAMLEDVNVGYILELANFHSVEFEGYASGEARLQSLFGSPKARARLTVEDFNFETGPLGTLDVDAAWIAEEGAVNISARATEDGLHHTDIHGYVSPKASEIDLKIKADGSSLKFLENYCSSFAEDIELRGWGDLNVVGPLKAIQLVGDARVSGSMRMTSLNTSYTLDMVPVRFEPDDIQLLGDTIRDIRGNVGVVSGNVFHRHLGSISYDISVDAHNLLAFDTHTFGEDTFYGTAYITGDCHIRGKSGEVVINVDATPNSGSQIVYNAASPDLITDAEFIHWGDRDEKRRLAARIPDTAGTNGEDAAERGMAANIYLNFLIHCTPESTLQLLMDERSGDYIALNGDGVIRAEYYNKGAFNLFGNYVVEHGVYKLTIQDVIKRDFEFLEGGTITFGGDAYNAQLNLQAQYTLNSVPLSDISLGSSLMNNNIRVDCIMNITGTPNEPHVDFTLDMPTVSNDAKQMVMSLMSSNEEVNQQVIYLLAVGRFLNQDNNSSTSQSQTSLAMQSILSGTISQQLSTLLDNVAGNSNWDFGANISTGDDGFYNAEYEGLVSGRLLNNRLVINGQFGYRDNQNATSSFIGDFDIRYLLVPSGSAAVRVYNQTNDKYFTKNSLNTQGIGLILKKDFSGWRDFFRLRKEKTNNR